MQSFTTEDLIQYLYKETSPEMTNAIKMALDSDWTLRERLELISAASTRLETVNYSPRQQTIDKIMEYAGRKEEELTPHA